MARLQLLILHTAADDGFGNNMKYEQRIVTWASRPYRS